MAETLPQEITPARLAATVLLLRDGAGGLEVMMLRKHAATPFAAGAWVFPGGTVDPADAELRPQQWRGLDPAAVAAQMGLDHRQALAVHVAAAREAFEEAGVLLATDAAGRPADPAVPRRRRARQALAEADRRLDFGAWLAAEELVLDLAELTPWVRWVTPAQEPRRYDTVFFVARAPAGTAADHDTVETVDSAWYRPGEALGRKMVYPTRQTLESLAAFATVEQVLAHAAAQRPLRRLQPHIVIGEDGAYVRIVHPDHPDYPHGLYAAQREAT